MRTGALLRKYRRSEYKQRRSHRAPTPNKLRKHFLEELALGMIDANYNVGKTFYEMAASGEDVAATIFWVKTRNMFREPSRDGIQAPPPFIVAPESGGPDD